MENKPQHCINCSQPLSQDTEIEASELKPRVNDFSICLFCGQPYVFIADLVDSNQLTRLPLTREQFNKLTMHEKQQIRAAWEVRKKLFEQVHDITEQENITKLRQQIFSKKNPT